MFVRQQWLILLLLISSVVFKIVSCDTSDETFDTFSYKALVEKQMKYGLDKWLVRWT